MTLKVSSKEDFTAGLNPQIQRRLKMFGGVTVTPLVRLDAGKGLEVAVAKLLAATDYP